MSRPIKEENLSDDAAATKKSSVKRSTAVAKVTDDGKNVQTDSGSAATTAEPATTVTARAKAGHASGKDTVGSVDTVNKGKKPEKAKADAGKSTTSKAKRGAAAKGKGKGKGGKQAQPEEGGGLREQLANSSQKKQRQKGGEDSVLESSSPGHGGSLASRPEEKKGLDAKKKVGNDAESTKHSTLNGGVKPETVSKEGNGTGLKNATNKKKKPVNNQNLAKDSQPKISDHFLVRRSTRISSGKSKSSGKSVNDRMVAELLAGGALDRMEKYDAKVKGLGVRTTAPIAKNHVVIEYNGDLLDFNDAVKREEEYGKNSEIGCYMYFFIFKGKKYCVDATYAPGIARLINHGKKKANLKTRLLDQDGHPRLVLVSTEDIAANTELLYDYGDRRQSATLNNEWLTE